VCFGLALNQRARVDASDAVSATESPDEDVGKGNPLNCFHRSFEGNLAMLGSTVATALFMGALYRSKPSAQERIGSFKPYRKQIFAGGLIQFAHLGHDVAAMA
jgi:hypothetical protein